MAEDELDDGVVYPREDAGDGVFLFSVDLSDEDSVCDSAEPPGTELILLHVREEEADGRVEGYGEHGGYRHGEVLGKCEGFEEPSFLGLQDEYRHERNGDDQESEEARSPHFLHGPDDDVLKFSRAPFGFPVLQLLVGLLDHHDGRVHHCADCDCDAAEGHNVRRDFHAVHGYEGDNDRNGYGDDGDDGARNMPEEYEDNETHDEEFLDQRAFQGVDRPFDELRAVVGCDDFHPRWEAGLYVGNLCLHAVDDLQGILTETHDDDPPYRLAFTVQLRDASADVGPEGHLAEVLQEDGRPRLGACGDHDVLHVPHGSDVTSPPDHVLTAGKLHEPPTHVVVPLSDGVHYLL